MISRGGVGAERGQTKTDTLVNSSFGEFEISSEVRRELKALPSADKWWGIGLALVDALLVCSSGLLAYKIRFSGHLRSISLMHVPQMPLVGTYLGFLLLYVTLLLLMAHAQRLYRVSADTSPLTESFHISRAASIAVLVLMAFIYISGNKSLSRLVVGLTFVFSLLTLSLWRITHARLVVRRLAKGIGLRHALIAGSAECGAVLSEYLTQNPRLGYDVRGFIGVNGHSALRVLGAIEDLSRIARREFIDEVFVTLPLERELVRKITLEAMQFGMTVKVVPEVYEGPGWYCPFELVGDVPVRVLHREPIPQFWLFVKRVTDVVGSSFGLLLLSPLFGAIAAAIKLDSKGRVLYRAKRVGKKGREFTCYKFRTMVPNADELKDKLRSHNERQGPFFKITNDPRTTRIGSFLRRYSLDELPQLWNVLKGDMSLVGPRPHPLDDFRCYSLEHFRRLDVTPGLTCLWQVYARQDSSFERALALDSEYIEKWNYLLDLRILLRTLPVVLKGSGN